MIKQSELVNLILMKETDDKPVAYNDNLRECYRLLNTYTFNQLELSLLRQEIWNALPQWRKSQIEDGKPA